MVKSGRIEGGECRTARVSAASCDGEPAASTEPPHNHAANDTTLSANACQRRRPE